VCKIVCLFRSNRSALCSGKGALATFDFRFRPHHGPRPLRYPLKAVRFHPRRRFIRLQAEAHSNSHPKSAAGSSP
jgi:hypothetical protein